MVDEPGPPHANVPDPADPLDTDTAPGLHWTRANVGEAMPGVQTPLSWTFWAGGIETSMRDAAYSVGALTRRERRVPEAMSDRAIRIFLGRVALNVEFMTMIGDRMPGTTGAETALSLIGSVPGGIDYRPTRRRYPLVAWRFPRTFLGTPATVRRFAADTDAWYPRAVARVGDLDRQAAVRHFIEARRRFTRAIILQTITVIAIIQPLYEALGELVKRAGTGDVGVLSGSGGPELAVVADVWRAAHGQIGLDEVIRSHGFHGPTEGELSSRVWREDPAPLRNLLPRYAERDDPRPVDEHGRRRAMQAQVCSALPWHLRPPARVLLSLCETRILIRGVLKRSFLQSFDVARASARRIGTLLAADGVLDHAEDVFYLTVADLEGELPSEVRRVVARRRELRSGHQTVDLPGAWTGRPVLEAREAGEVETSTLTGTGVSAGVVEGVVRVVLDPVFDEVEPGEILVAPTTDPSWASIMYLSGGLVVDIGGALSHAALVAREMGIPCVVSTGRGTTLLHTGDRVRVDGSAGTVEILESSSSQGVLTTP